MSVTRRLVALLGAHVLLAAFFLSIRAYPALAGVPPHSATSPETTGDAASAAFAPADTWAVIVSSSRYWLNYRHTANALGVYQAVRRLGVPDSRILLMLADQPACSPRNIYPGQLFMAPGAADAAKRGVGAQGAQQGVPGWQQQEAGGNLLARDAEVDYRGREVSVDSVLRVLTGRHLPGTPASKRLLSGPSSSLLLFLTGHGGDEFLKFHDQEELLASDLAAAIGQMHAAGRYRQLLLMADTCQASTLFGRITAPNVLGIASSKLGQSSYAHHIDTTIGQHVVDQFSFYLHHFLTHRLPPHPAFGDGGSPSRGGSSGGATAAPSLQDLVDFFRGQRLSSEVQVWTDLFPRRLADVAVSEFFSGAAAPAHPSALAPPGASKASTNAAGGPGGGRAGSPAAWALLRAAEPQRSTAPQGEAQRAPTPEADGTFAWQPPALYGGRLFEALQAPGNTTTSAVAGASDCLYSRCQAALAVVGGWAAAVGLSFWLLRAP